MAQTFERPLRDLSADIGQAGDLPDRGVPDDAAQVAPTGRLTAWALALFIGALLAAAIVLWARNGVTVFFDVMAAGIAACF